MISRIHIANSLAILFEGYSQGVIAGVNMSPGRISTKTILNSQCYANESLQTTFRQ
jgi:hypothetical protein